MTIAADPVAHEAAAPTDAKTVRTAVLASLVGTTIEWYDFFLYATAASLVFNHAFFPDQSSFVGTMLAFATFAVGFVVRPIGGFVFGHVGDRIGRKRTLALTMLLLRIVQGFALGGEWGGAVLLAVEHSPRNRRGLFGSIPQVGLALGLALGTGVFVVLQLALSAEAFQSYGWRIAFLISIVLVIFGVVVRFRVAETPAFEQIRRDDDRASVPLREIFRPPTLRSTVLGLLSRWGEGAAFNTWGVFTISYATATLHLGKVPVLIVVTAAAVLMAVLLPVSGLLADRFSPRTVYASGIAAYGVVVFPAFLLFGTGSIAAYAVGMLLAFGVIHAWFYGAQGTLYASLFPTRTRYTGLSTVYQLSGVYSSGLTPLILTALIAAGHGRPWYACAYLVTTAAISFVATLLLKPEH